MELLRAHAASRVVVVVVVPSPLCESLPAPPTAGRSARAAAFHNDIMDRAGGWPVRPIGGTGVACLIAGCPQL